MAPSHKPQGFGYVNQATPQEQRSFFSRLKTPLQLLGIFILVRLVMISLGVMFIRIPYLDHQLVKVVKAAEKFAER